MGAKFATGKKAFGFCDRCGHRAPLHELKPLTIKTKQVNIKVCNECWEPDHPQLSLGLYPVQDFMALRDPRPDNSFYQSGQNSLQLLPGNVGFPDEGSRTIQWGWAPVGGSSHFDANLTPNDLNSKAAVGSVTIQLS